MEPPHRTPRRKLPGLWGAVLALLLPIAGFFIVFWQAEAQLEIAPRAVHLFVPGIRTEPGNPPTLRWGVADTTRLWIGYSMGTLPIAGFEPPGWIVDLEGQDGMRPARAGEWPPDFPPSDPAVRRREWAPWMGTGSYPLVPRVENLGVTLGFPRGEGWGFPGSLSFNDPHHYGLRTLRASALSDAHVLLRSLVWNVRTRSWDERCFTEPRGRWVAYVYPMHDRWEIWLWPRTNPGS